MAADERFEKEIKAQQFSTRAAHTAPKRAPQFPAEL